MTSRQHSRPHTFVLLTTAAAVLMTGLTTGPGVSTARAAGPPDSGPATLTRAGDGALRYSDPSASGETRTLTGVLVSEVDHVGEPSWSIARADGTTVPVEVARPLPESLTTSDVTARVTEDGELAAADVQPAAAPAAVPTPMRHTVYLAKVTNRGDYGGATDADIEAVVQRGLDRWVAESNGYITSFTIAQVKDVQAVDTTPDDGNPCESGMKVWRQFEDDFDKAGDFFDQDGEHLLAVQPRGCGGGVGSGGSGIDSSGGLTFDYHPAKNTTTIPHELGHNFGLGHATALSCSSGTCANADYGNSYNAMGASIINNPPTDPGAFDSFDRDKLAITSPGELQQLTLPVGRRTTTGTFALRGRATDLGARGIKVTNPVTGQPWYVDFRNGVGRDANASYARNRDRTTGFRLGVTVQRTVNAGKQSELQTTSLTDGASNYALRGGESWTSDDGGVRVAVTSLDTTASADAVARLSVTLTDPSVPTPTPAPTRFQKTVKPTLSGAGRVGGQVRVGLRKQLWKPAPTRAAYRWHVGNRLVRGATTDKLRLKAAYRGKNVWATVTATRPGYESVTSSTRRIKVTNRR